MKPLKLWQRLAIIAFVGFITFHMGVGAYSIWKHHLKPALAKEQGGGFTLDRIQGGSEKTIRIGEGLTSAAAYGWNEEQSLWTRIQTDQEGYVICRLKVKK